MKSILSALLALVISLPAHSAGLESITGGEATTGLRDALTQGASFAVGKLGVTDGFFKNPKVKIPLPDTLRRIESGLRTFGMGKQADELVLTMNRAAEAAVPEAKALLVDAVKKMSVQDAKKILTGGDNAATEYFRKATSAQLTQKFLPIVTKATSKVGLAEKYNNLAGKAAQYKLIDDKDAKIENYVTAKALDGLYLMIAEQERSIRKDPVGAATSAAKKVFGALRN